MFGICDSLLSFSGNSRNDFLRRHSTEKEDDVIIILNNIQPTGNQHMLIQGYQFQLAKSIKLLYLNYQFLKEIQNVFFFENLLTFGYEGRT